MDIAMEDINWHRIASSSNVTMIGWPTSVVAAKLESDPKILFVLFSHGKCYGYLGVSRQRAAWMAAGHTSLGEYINQVIKPNFEAVRIPELDVAVET